MFFQNWPDTYSRVSVSAYTQKLKKKKNLREKINFSSQKNRKTMCGGHPWGAVGEKSNRRYNLKYHPFYLACYVRSGT